MKKILFTLFLLTLFISGCKHGLFRDTVKMDRIISEKQKIDAAENPALRYRLIENLKKDVKIKITDILVKDIIISNNIDYDFCVIGEVTSDGKTIECFIYSDDTDDIAALKKGTSRINVVGLFSRFLSIKGEYFTKVDIIKADIEVIKTK